MLFLTGCFGNTEESFSVLRFSIKSKSFGRYSKSEASTLQDNISPDIHKVEKKRPLEKKVRGEKLKEVEVEKAQRNPLSFDTTYHANS